MFPKPGCGKAAQKEQVFGGNMGRDRGHTVPWGELEQRALSHSLQEHKAQEVEERPINETLRYHIYFTSTQFYQGPTLSPP